MAAKSGLYRNDDDVELRVDHQLRIVSFACPFRRGSSLYWIGHLGANDQVTEINYATVVEGNGKKVTHVSLKFHPQLDFGALKVKVIFDNIQFNLSYVSEFFRKVSFEFDSERDQDPDLKYSDGNKDHTIKSVFNDAGFEVAIRVDKDSIRPQRDGEWTNDELHYAMEKHWSQYSNRPGWRIWVGVVGRHEDGFGLGGIMFDSIGAQHRQGCAVFNDSFISYGPYKDRMPFWCTIHEMGHCFNLAHSWQKALGERWLKDMDNESSALSFMNYPFAYKDPELKGRHEDEFWEKFDYQFSQAELLFLRHAPEEFVMPGSSAWFTHHGAHKDVHHVCCNHTHAHPSLGSHSRPAEEALSDALKKLEAEKQRLQKEGRDISEDEKRLDAVIDSVSLALKIYRL